ncbi:hypothetical protein [Latilactobacillus sakei]|uniref:hypothetical protein n=1 Tax=Latilactobacillus sakei TaxID=1599 RepID=UPI003F535BA7
MKKTHDTFRSAYLYPENIPLSFSGAIKLHLLNFMRLIKRSYRFLQRLWPDINYLILVTIALIFFYACVQLWGFSTNKYHTLSDGLWDMKSTFITVIGLGLLDICYKNSQSWHAKLVLQYNFKIRFDSLKSYILEVFSIVAQEDKASEYNELSRYTKIKISENDIKEFDEATLKSALNKAIIELDTYQRDLDRIELAVQQHNIQMYIAYLKEALKILNKRNIQDAPERLNNLIFLFYTINYNLSAPWRWDTRLTERRKKIIKSTAVTKKLSVDQKIAVSNIELHSDQK